MDVLRGGFCGRLSDVTLTRKAAGLAVVAALIVVAALYGGYRFHTYWTLTRTVPLERVELVTPMIGGQQAYIATPARGGGTTLVLFMHGYGADHQVLTLPRAHDFAQRLVDRGFTVAASDAHNDEWGGPATQADYVALYEHVAASHNISRVVIVSESMGAIAASHLIADDAIPNVVGWVSVSPVLDLEAAASKPPLQNAIGTDLTPAAVTELDPKAIDPDVFDMPRVAYLGKDDAVVFAEDARPAAARLGIEVRACSGEHVSKDCYRAGDVARFAR